MQIGVGKLAEVDEMTSDISRKLLNVEVEETPEMRAEREKKAKSDAELQQHKKDITKVSLLCHCITSVAFQTQVFYCDACHKQYQNVHCFVCCIRLNCCFCCRSNNGRLIWFRTIITTEKYNSCCTA